MQNSSRVSWFLTFIGSVIYHQSVSWERRCECGDCGTFQQQTAEQWAERPWMTEHVPSWGKGTAFVWCKAEAVYLIAGHDSAFPLPSSLIIVHHPVFHCAPLYLTLPVSPKLQQRLFDAQQRLFILSRAMSLLFPSTHLLTQPLMLFSSVAPLLWPERHSLFTQAW